jgi:hypothetical protein
VKIKVDTTGVETQATAVKPGLYSVKVKDAEGKESGKGKPMLAVIFEIQGGEFDGRALYDYIPLDDDSMMWKLASFQDAMGLKRKATIDTDDLIDKKCQVRTVVQKSEEYGEQARIRNILGPKGAKQTDEDLGDDDDDDDDDEVDYSELSLKELKAEIKERELEPDKTTKKALIEALEADDEEDDDDSDDDDDDDEDEQDYEEMTLKELKDEIEERELEIEGKATKAKLIEALEENDDEDEDEDEDDDDDDEVDYEEYSLKELKDELKERSLKTAGKKDVLVARLEKDDKAGSDGEPF